MKHAHFKTNKGDFTVELNDELAPKSVANFLAYVAKKQYDGTIFHRVIDGFMVQGGGFAPGMKQAPTDVPIENEADNGLKNDQYTIAMARTNDPHSATAQFFINVGNNEFLNHSSKTPQGWGYAVFGRVTEGQDVIDTIRAVKTGSKGFHQDVPVEDVVLLSVTAAITGNIEATGDIVEEAAANDQHVYVPTAITSVWRPESAHYFVAEDVMKPWEVKLDGIDPFLTSAYKVGETFSLLGISQTEYLLSTGMLDSTDAIDPNVSLSLVHIKGSDGSMIVVEGSWSPTSKFHYAVKNNYRVMSLDAKFDNVKVPDRAGVEHDLSFMMVGNVNLELADTVVHAGPVLDSADNGVKFEVIGYKLNANRVNHNRRERAQFARGENPAIQHIDEAGYGVQDNSGKFAKGNTVDTHQVKGAETGLTVTIGDEPAATGGANHRYDFTGFNTENNPSELPGSAHLAISLIFQNGPIPSVGVNGVTLEAVLAACGHRLEGFQAGQFACADNQEALDAINIAIEALQRRTRARIARGVEGTYKA
jgi:peptidyl-prolyl cis-trans isomerase B (cyclophilin B)